MMKKATTSAPKIYTPSSKIHAKRINKTTKDSQQPKNPDGDSYKNRTNIHQDKQNIEATQNMSPMVYRPNRKRSLKIISCQNTVSLIVNESTNVQQSLLDSLLYEEKQEQSQFPNLTKDLVSQSCMLEVEEEENLLQSCEEEGYFSQLSQPRISPAYFQNIGSKSMKFFTAPDNEINKFKETNSALRVQRVGSSPHRLCLNFHNCDRNFKEEKILTQRLWDLIKQKPESLLTFFRKIHLSTTIKDIQNSVRPFLFQNGVIFNRSQLSDFVSLFYEEKIQEHDSQKLNSEIIGDKLEEIFILRGVVNPETISQFQIHDEKLLKIIFPRKETKNEKNNSISLWKFLSQIYKEQTSKSKGLEQSLSNSRMKTVNFSHSFYQQNSNSGRKLRKQDSAFEDYLSNISNWLQRLFSFQSQKQVEYKIKITSENPKKLN